MAEFRRELLNFPAGKHDDQVDALGLIGQLLDRMIGGHRPKEVKPFAVDLTPPTLAQVVERTRIAKARVGGRI